MQELDNFEKPSSPLEVPTVWKEFGRIFDGEDSNKVSENDSNKMSGSKEDELKCVFLKLHANATRRVRW